MDASNSRSKKDIPSDMIRCRVCERMGTFRTYHIQAQQFGDTTTLVPTLQYSCNHCESTFNNVGKFCLLRNPKKA